MNDLVRLAGVTVAVPDPAATADFFATGIDLEAVEGPDGAIDLTSEGDYGTAPPPRMLTLVPGDSLQLQGIAFDLADGVDLGQFADAVSQRVDGVEEVPAEGPLAAGVAFDDLSGFRVECRGRSTPLARDLAASGVRPRRLGHVNMKVADAGAAAKFYESALGLRLSERIGDLLYFLRVGSDHHNVGFRGGAEHPNLHHVAFEIHGWETYRVICDRLAALGHRVEYGPGRHGPGHNLFVYMIDPSSGLRLELFSDMAHIDDEAYEPIVWETVDRSRTVNVWGPAPPKSFLE